MITEGGSEGKEQEKTSTGLEMLFLELVASYIGVSAYKIY